MDISHNRNPSFDNLTSSRDSSSLNLPLVSLPPSRPRSPFLNHEKQIDPESGYATPSDPSHFTIEDEGEAIKQHLLDISERSSISDSDGSISPTTSASQHATTTYTITKRENVINIIIIIINTLAAVGVVFLNKAVFKYPQFQNAPVSFTCSHFLCTSTVLWIASHRPFNLFEPIRISIIKILPLSIAFCAWVLLNNLSLLYNPISFYQLAKIMTVPCVVVLNFIVFKAAIDLKTALCLISVCFGVALTNTGEGAEKTTTILGSCIAVAAFVATAVYQIWIQKKHRELRVTSPQLLLCQAPLGAGLLLFFVPFSDQLPDPRTVPVDGWLTLLASALMASVLNLTAFLVIGRTSTITYNVVSNLKTVIILCLGWISDGRKLSQRDLTGIVFAVGGAFVYSQVAQRKK